jgi:hypothetical protein
MIKIRSSHFAHLDIFAINVTGLAIGILLYYVLDSKIEIIGACLAATISISVGLTNYKIADDRLFKELFESFNTKYDQKFNESLNAITDASDAIDDKLIVDYLNFCSEEYLWFKRKRIPPKVWRARRAGILFHLGKAPIKQIAEKEMKQKESYYGLFDDLGW